MSRTITTRNLNHPHNRLNAYRQTVFARYRQLSRRELDQLCAREGIELTLTRKAKLETIVEQFVAKWKKEFAKEMGFPFEDVADPRKLTQHLADSEERRALLIKDGIDHRPLFAGEYITREQFAALTPEQQSDVRNELHQRTLAIIKSGYAGVVTQEEGLIVDRRLHPGALPIPENQSMGSPKPIRI